MTKGKPASEPTHNPVSLVWDSAQQVWVTGLDACTRVGQAGGRVLDGVVDLGERIEAAARGRVHRAAEAVRAAWEHSAGIVRGRVARTLNSLQIPTARDIQELNRRVAGLQATVERLARDSRPAKRTRPARRKAAASSRSTPRKASAGGTSASRAAG